MPIKKSKINNENLTNNNSNSNSEVISEDKKSEDKKEINEEFIFNKVLNNSLKNKNIFKKINVKINSKSKFKTNEEYQSDFDDIIAFRKKITKREIEQINMIIYHDENNDGFFSAAIAYNYLNELKINNNTSNQKNHQQNYQQNQIQIVGLKPVHGKFIQIKNPDIYKNKNILILDLDYKTEYLEELSKLANSIILIDDHQKGIDTSKNNSNKLNIFRGRDERHATCAYTWKFFYPKEDIPLAVQFIDDSDLKLFLPFFSRKIAHSFSQAIGHRFAHNKSSTFMQRKKSGKVFIDIWELISEKYLSLKYLVFIGKYYDEVIESLKNQIAINAKPAKFQGYDVAVLNFNAPGIKKQVGRQIMSNYKMMGSGIKFCVLWGYEYTSQCYDITIMDDHSQYSTINLKEIAQKLGDIGGTKKGGGGHQHEAHFYWPHNDKYDIWDLFKKTYI